jgi:hypothetical protein
MVALRFLSGPSKGVLRLTRLPKIGNNYHEFDMEHAFLWLDNNLFHR